MRPAFLRSPCLLRSTFASPPRPQSFPLLSTATTVSRAMVKDKTVTMERSKKAASGKGRRAGRVGLSSRSGLPAGWIQGDWIWSTIVVEDLEELEEEGLIARGSWRVVCLVAADPVQVRRPMPGMSRTIIVEARTMKKRRRLRARFVTKYLMAV